MLDAGFRISAVHSGAPGEPPGFDWSLDIKGLDIQAITARNHQCDALMPSPHTATVAEIRQVYDRWVGEYSCLVGLGYHPDTPPSVETFIASYNTGPWMPIDGIDTTLWTDADFHQAKAKCTLEFLLNVQNSR
jgi:hypothetical protein